MEGGLEGGSCAKEVGCAVVKVRTREEVEPEKIAISQRKAAGKAGKAGKASLVVGTGLVN